MLVIHFPPPSTAPTANSGALDGRRQYFSLGMAQPPTLDEETVLALLQRTKQCTDQLQPGQLFTVKFCDGPSVSFKEMTALVAIFQRLLRRPELNGLRFMGCGSENWEFKFKKLTAIPGP